MSTENRPFEKIVTLEEFCAEKKISPSHIKVAKTNNGKILLTALGSPIATVKTELQGNSPRETVMNIAACAAICFGMPKAGSVDQSGRASLPCCMESTSQWEEVALF